MAILMRSENEGYYLIRDLFRRTTIDIGEEVNGYRMNLVSDEDRPINEESFLEISWLTKKDERGHIIKYEVSVNHNGKLYGTAEVTKIMKNGIQYINIITKKGPLISFYIDPETSEILVKIGEKEYFTKNIESIVNDIFNIGLQDRYETWIRIDIDRRELRERQRETRERSLSRRRRREKLEDQKIFKEFDRKK